MSVFNKTFALTIRSLRVDSRNLSPHLMRAGLGLFVMLFLMTIHSDIMYQAPGRTLFGWIIYTNAVFASFIVPMLFANTVTEEKEERTLALLQIADVSALTLLIGKSLPRMLSLFQIFVIQLPFCMLAITLGGISLDQILASYVAVVSYSFFLACLGLWCSVMFRLSANAMGLAGIIMVAYHIVPWILFAICSILALDPFWGGFSKQTLRALSAFWPTTISTRLPEILAAGYSGGIYHKQVLVNVLMGIVFFVLALSSFDYFNREADSTPVRRRSQRSAGKSSRKRRAWNHAIIWKEFYFSSGGVLYIVGKFVLYGATVALITMAASGWRWNRIDVEDSAMICSGIMFFLFLPIEVVLTVARTFYPEVRDKTLSSLVLLPVSIGHLAYHKIFGGFMGMIPVFTYLFLGLLIAPDPITEIFEAVMRDPFEMFLVYLNVIAQCLLYLHGVAWLSIRMNGWWAIFVAGLTQYFAMLFVSLSFMISLTFAGVNPPDWSWEILALFSGVVVLGCAIFLHINIGAQLKQKAAST